ncbi:MAG: carboxypeptidase-like regulatory domain-containing protein [Planctomycetota bacterium]
MHRNLLILASLSLSGAALWIAWSSLKPTHERSDPWSTLNSDASSESEAQQTPLDTPPQRSEAARAPAALPVQADNQPQLIVAGRVVSEAGLPVDGALVSVRYSGPQTATSAPWTTKKQATTSSYGRFEFRGTEQPDSLVLSASMLGYSDSNAVLAEPGEDGVELVLKDGAVVAGRLVVDHEVDLNAIRLSLDARYRENEHDLGLQLADWGLRPSADGSFSFEEVNADQVRLSVSVEGERLLDIDGIQVGKAGTGLDPRLNPLDLRGRFHQLTIELQDDSGRSIANGTVALLDSMGVRGKRRMAQGGKARFLVAHGAYDFDVEAPGWRRERLSAVSDDRVVRLRRGYPVRVVLTGALELPPPPYRLAVGLLVDGEKPGSDLDGMGSFVDSGETTLVASRSGPHEVGWYLETGSRSRFLYGPKARKVDVRESDEEQTIVVDLDPVVRRSWEAMVKQAESGK